MNMDDNTIKVISVVRVVADWSGTSCCGVTIIDMEILKCRDVVAAP